MRGRGVFVAIVGVLFAIFVLQLVFGAYLARNTAGNTQLNLREDVSLNLTVLINNTETSSANNITQINITFPSSFTFAAGTNVSNTVVRTNFTNATTLLSWSNWTVPMIMNQTWAYFSFNLSAPDPGFYNITVIFVNTTGTSTFNLTAIVNDTTAPSADFVTPTPTNNSYLRVNTLIINTSSVDNWNISNFFTAIYNSSGLANSSNVLVSVNTTNVSTNFTGLVDGIYYYNTTVNDTFNNSISNVNVSETRTLTVDTAAPNISLTLNTASTSDLNIVIAITDGLSGINGTCSVNRAGASISGSSTTQTLTEANLNCAETVSYTVTCLDRAGNSRSNTTSFITNGCSSSSSSSSSGSSSGSSTAAPTVWSTTFSDNQTALSSTPVSRDLGVLQRTAISIAGEQHFVGIKSISGTTAVIEVSSTPQQGTLSVGQSKKFELNSDAYYDLLVTLVSINSGTANVTMTSIHESLVEAAAANQVNSSTNQTVVASSSSGKTGLWITIIIVLIVLGGAVYYFFYIKKKPNYD